jgi:isoleucyl-tRNA synthetase
MKANLPKREPEMLAHWEEIKLYDLLMRARQGAPAWILHDGPPYANGRVHMGTALNKVLKDLVVRSSSGAYAARKPKNGSMSNARTSCGWAVSATGLIHT